jgi:[ribosomal protein S5]-alanine N-acetyltransferase
MNKNGKPEVEVAYMVHRDYWNLGIASEAATACREYAFDVLKVARVVSMIRPANHASLRVAEKLGMRRIGETMHAGLLHDLYENRRETGF